MAKNYKDYSYFANRPDVVKVWEDLEAYLDWCRFELREFNPADLYRRDSQNYGAYLASKRPRRPYQGNKPRFDNNKPRFDNNKPRFDNNKPRFDNNSPRFERGTR